MTLIAPSALYCLLLLAARVPSAPSTDSAAAPLTVEAAIAQALATNPALAAARLRRAVDRAGVDVARERPNPEARVELERETPKEAYGMSLPLETGGKRARRVEVAAATVRTGDAEIEALAARTRADVRRAYFASVAADARSALLGDLRALAVRARDAAQDRFAAGSAPRLEVLEARLALAQADNEVSAAAASADAARIDLDALLGWPLDRRPVLATPLDAGVVPTIEAAVDRARHASAELQLLSRRIDEQQARVALARALQAPDVVPEATVTRNAEPEFAVGWRAALSVAVPVFTRHTAGVRVEQATLAQARADAEAAGARVAGAVASAAAIASAGLAQYARYRDEILPQAVEVEQMAADAYRLGQTGITPYLQALQTSRDARLRALQAGLDFQNALADLEDAMGAPLP